MVEMHETVPNGLEHIGYVMSNFDHEIDPDAEERLKGGSFYGEYSAWNFHGTVWFDGEQFLCQIMRYCSHAETIAGESLREIMEKASDTYGSQ